MSQSQNEGKALKEMLHIILIMATEKKETKTEEPSVSRRRFLKYGVGVVAVAAAAGGGYYYLTSRPAPTPTVTGTTASATAVRTFSQPFFRMDFLCPINNLSRVAWSGMIADSLKKIGVDCNLIFADWDIIWPRVYTDVEHTSKSYADGGYDTLSIGWDPPIVYDPAPYYSKKNMPLYNAMMWQNDENEALIDKYESTVDQAAREDILKQWQRLWLREIPNTMVSGGAAVVAVAPNLEGYDPLQLAHRWDCMIGLSLTGVTGGTIICAVAGEVFQFGGILMTLDYEYQHGGAAYSMPAMYDYDQKKFLPYVAESWDASEDAKHWVVRLRKDVKWHDGWPVTAKDVKFTWDSILNPDVGAPANGIWKSVFGSADAYKVTGDYEITCDLPAPMGLFVETVLACNGSTPNMIVPEHVLGSIPVANWRKHTFNTGIGSYDVKTPEGKTYTAYGPIGNGPFIFMGYDPTKRQTHLKKNPDYFAKDQQGNVEDIYLTYFATVDAAIAALKAREIQLVSFSWYFFNKVNQIDPSWGKVLKVQIPSHQEWNFNMNSPIWGSGVATPLGKQDPSRAAEAARWVRQAFAHCVPRSEIKDVLLNGFGVDLVTPVLPSAAYGYDPTLQNYEFDLEKAKDCMEKAGYLYQTG